MTPHLGCFIIEVMIKEIKPNGIYTTKEARSFLRISESTVKRFLKGGIIKAYKVGGRYKILGRELLRLISPEVEIKARDLYYSTKEKTKKTIEKW